MANTPPVEIPDNKYRAGGMMYPDDLMSNSQEYGGNYVIFNINVHQDSALVRDNPGKYMSAEQTPPTKRDSMSGTGVNKFVEGAVLAGAGVGAVNALNPVGRAMNAVGYSLKPGRETVANLAAGAVVTGAALYALGGTRNSYQQQLQAIALYLPNDLSIKYGVVWDETSLAGTAAIMAGAENLGAAALKTGGMAVAGGMAMKALGGSKRAQRLATLGGGAVGLGLSANNIAAGEDIAAAQALKAPGMGEYLSKSTGIASNPKKEQLFKEIRFRDFSYNYQFFPRSAGEAANVIAIIKEFKKHMHPEFKDKAQFLYVYPSEFQITYYTGGKISQHLPKHTSCVLTDMSVQYSPQGVYTSFPNGMPTQINVSLSFRELALLTKQDIEVGY